MTSPILVLPGGRPFTTTRVNRSRSEKIPITCCFSTTTTAPMRCSFIKRMASITESWGPTLTTLWPLRLRMSETFDMAVKYQILRHRPSGISTPLTGGPFQLFTIRREIMLFEQTDKIEHDLHPYFQELLRFNSTKSLEESAIYRELKPAILKALNNYELS